jgi:hypothetical protein
MQPQLVRREPSKQVAKARFSRSNIDVALAVDGEQDNGLSPLLLACLLW